MKKIGVLSFIEIVLYSICKSRNAVVITVGLSMLALLLRDKRIKNKIKKPLNLVSSWIVFVCIVFSILPGYLRYKGILLNYWYAFDQIFTNRSMLAASAFQSYAGYLGLLLFSVQHYGLTGVIATYLLQALAVVFIKEVIMRKRNYQELM